METDLPRMDGSETGKPVMIDKPNPEVHREPRRSENQSLEDDHEGRRINPKSKDS